MADWQPDEGTARQLAGVLSESLSSQQEARLRARQALDEAKINPDLNNYLVYLLVIPVSNVREETRATAGLWLKNNIILEWSRATPQSVEYIKGNILRGLVDQEHLVRNISGIVLTSLYSKLGISGWPELLQQLLQMIDSPVATAKEGAMSALSKICEDSASELDRDVTGKGERPLKVLVPRLIEFCGSEFPRIRSDAVFCLTQLIPLQSQDFLAHIDMFLQALFTLANDTYPETRRNIASAFNQLLEIRPDKLAPHLEGVVNFCLHLVKDEDEKVSLEGAEFILSLAETLTLDDIYVEPLVPTIVPVILTTMVYSEMDMFVLENINENDENEADRAEDIKPVNIKSKEGHTVKAKHENDKLNSQNEEDDEEDDDDDGLEDSLDDWNLRKCSAAAVDALSMKFAPLVLKVAQPHLLERINSSEWAVRESAVLAFGAVAQGCLNFGNVEFVPELISFLIKLLHDDHAQIREISCWTIGRYGAPVVDNDDIFTSVFQGLMQCSLDHNKKVQEAGCSSLAVMAELAGDKLSPYTEPLLHHFQACFNKYQQKNMIALYECIQTTVTAISSALDEPKYVELLMDPMVKRWQLHEDFDRELLPLLECLSTVAASAGESFAPYAPAVFQRCAVIIKTTLMLQGNYEGNPDEFDPPEKEFLVCAVDLLDGLVQGLQNNVRPLIDGWQDPPLMDMVQVCFNDDMPEVRQSCFALIGDMAIYTYEELQPRVDAILPPLIMNISISEVHLEAVCNNAMWAVGEISLHLGRGTEKFFNELFQRLGQVLVGGTNASLLENAAIVIGRLGISLADLIAPHLQSIIDRWLTIMADVEETNERDTSFQGMCRIIAANPTALHEQQLLVLFMSFAAYYDPSMELRVEIMNLLQGYKSFIPNFDALAAKLDPPVLTQLQAAYNL